MSPTKLKYMQVLIVEKGGEEGEDGGALNSLR